jgi:hypothetical protein
MAVITIVTVQFTLRHQVPPPGSAIFIKYNNITSAITDPGRSGQPGCPRVLGPRITDQSVPNLWSAATRMV